MKDPLEFEVCSIKEGKWWVVYINGKPRTQVKNLVNLQSTVEDYLSLQYDVDPKILNINYGDNVDLEKNKVISA